MKKLLEDQRKKSKIDPEELACLLYRGKDRFERVKDYWAKVTQIIGNNDPRVYEMNRDQLVEHVQRKVSLLRAQKQPGFCEEEDPCLELLLTHNFQFPGSTGQFMVVQVLRTLGSDSQREEWVPKIRNHLVQACYAQTELSVGSDTQSVGTLSIFDEKTQEFIIHSPAVENMKWWPSDLSITSNHALVVARLVSKGKDHGIQSFFVEIRDPITHVPRKGVEIGDVGPKLGAPTKEHGFMRFTKYRVPKSSLLSRFISVDESGEVSFHGNRKRMYAGMMMMRSAISIVSYTSVFKAATIATRYSLYRTQFKDSKGFSIPIYDYQVQREKLFREISRAYAMALTSRSLIAQLEKNTELSKKDDFSELQNTHIMLCVCKANFSSWATVAHGNLLKACGGHGFSQYSGLPQILTEEFLNQIVEGDNSVLLLQVSRELLKQYRYVKRGETEKLKGPFQFLSDFDKFTSSKELSNPAAKPKIARMIEILRVATCFILDQTGRRVEALLEKHRDAKLVMNQMAGNENLRLAKIYSILFVVQNAADQCQMIQEPSLREKIGLMVELASISFFEEVAMTLLEAGAMEPRETGEMHRRKDEILDLIKEDGLLLAEGMQWRDEHLWSAIGSSDKEPYETMYDWAKRFGVLNRYDDKIHPAIIEYQTGRHRGNGQKL